MDELVWVLLGLALVFGPPILAIVALVRDSEIGQRLGAVEHRMAQLVLRFEELERRLSPTAASAETAPASPMPSGAAEPATPEPAAPIAAPEPETAATAASQAPEPTSTPVGQPNGDTKTGAGGGKPGSGWRGLEAALTQRWLVWLGAIAIALAGTFLVKFAIDSGWMGPVERVSSGFLAGLLLIGAGEWLRRNPLQRAVAKLQPDHVPAALTASGLFVDFTSLYAAHALYGLLPPGIAFAALAAVALGGLGLALVQGRLVALLGLLGAFATPLLVEVDRPSAWLLFSYLLPIEFACLALARYRGWWWYAAAALGGAGLWALTWMLMHGTGPSLVPLGLFLLASYGGAIAVGHGHPRLGRPISSFADSRNVTGADAILWAATSGFAFLFVSMVMRNHHGALSVIYFGAFAASVLVVARQSQGYDLMAVGIAIATLAMIVVWPMPLDITMPESILPPGEQIRRVVLNGPLVPPELVDFAVALAGFAALFGIAGYRALRGAERPVLWASVSAVMPVLLLVIAFWRIVDFALDIRWAALALGLAAGCLFAAGRIERWLRGAALDGSLGFYAAAVVGFISLGAAMTLKQAWLTVALAVQLPALGWIAGRIPARTIRYVAASIAAVVLVRLGFNPRVLDYGLPETGLLSWVLYGYGLPAIAFFIAAHLFDRHGAPRLATLLQAGGLAFSVLLVFWQTRYVVSGTLDNNSYDLFEQSLQTAAWIAIGYGLLQHARIGGNRVSYYGARILLALGAMQALAGHLLLANPLVTGDPVGEAPFVNLLALAYLLPALAAVGIAVDRRPDLPRVARFVAGPMAVLLSFVYVTLEIKHAFQGTVLMPYSISDAEFYAYSAGWLVFAGILLTVGILRASTPIRQAALAVLLVAVIKVFGFDMADLTGLYRVASFFGLGLSLIGIGWLYQRYVFRPATPPETQQTAAPAS